MAVEAGVCDGFIGNRILTRYRHAADRILLEGATPWQVDAAMVAFGMAMGPYAAQDLSGLDIAYANRQRKRQGGEAAAGASLSRKTDGGRVAAIRYDPAGATLTLCGTTIARVEGGAVRIVTDGTGRLVALRGIEMQDQQVTLTTPGRSPRRVRLPANRDLPA